jgi:hypothetical protein
MYGALESLRFLLEPDETLFRHHRPDEPDSGRLQGWDFA